MLELDGILNNSSGLSGIKSRWFYASSYLADGILPNLITDFENQRYAVNGSPVAFDDLFTFTRASTATYVDADGVIQTAAINEPRFDWRTGRKGLFIEDDSTNLYLKSVDMHGSTSSNSGGRTIETTELAPDGVANAVKLECLANVYSGAYTKSTCLPTLTAGQAYCFSIFLKKDEESESNVLRFGSDTVATWGDYYFHAKFNIAEKTWEALGSRVDAYGYKEIGNGWIKVWISGIPDNTGPSNIFFFNSSGSETLSAYIWGLQVEEGSFPASYIPTDGSAVTRAADSLSITDMNFSNWFNISEGTFLLDFTLKDTSNNILFDVGDGSWNNRIYVELNSWKYVQAVVASSGNYFYNNFSKPVTDNKAARMAVAYGSSESVITLDGEVPETESIVLPIGVDRIRFGGDAISNGHHMSGVIHSFTYYLTRLSDTALQELTE